MGHAAKRRDRGVDRRGCDADAFGSQRRGLDVAHVVGATQANVRAIRERLGSRFHPTRPRARALRAIVPDMAAGRRGPIAARVGIIIVEDGDVVWLLVAEDGGLRLPILFHRVVGVQVVGQQIGEDGHLWTQPDGVQPFEDPVAQLEHGPARGCDLRQQRERLDPADVAAEERSHPRALQDVVQEDCRSRFAARPCDARDRTRARTDEPGDLHLDALAGVARQRQIRRGAAHIGVTHDHVGAQEVGLIVAPQDIADRQPVQLGDARRQHFC